MSTFSGMQYGDNAPRIGIYAVAKFLAHAQPMLFLERFAAMTSVPAKQGQTIKWRRAVPFNVSTDQLVEGVTPSPTGVVYEDVTSQLAQWGAWIPFTDVLIETHEDDNLNVYTQLAAEQAALTKERILWNTMIAGTNVGYSGTATQRSDVQAPLDIGDVRLVQRALKNALAKPLTKMVSASEKISTQPIAPAYIAIGHTNLEQDFRALTGFVPREYYSDSTKILSEHEIGKIEDLRIMLAPHLTYFPGAGSTTTTGVLFTGANVDVYPIVFLGQDAFGATTLKGMDLAKVGVKNPKMAESEIDPLGQRGFVALTKSDFRLAA